MGGTIESRRIAYETARLRLARYRLEGAQARTAAAEHATRVSAEALDVERVGVWLLRERAHVLVCSTLYDRQRRERSAGHTLDARRHPGFFAALAARRVVAADDAADHHHTRELLDGYLRPAGVRSLLAAPIIRDGHVVGMVCHEQLASARAWTQRELEFASAVADALALSYEQADRLELEAALQEQAEQRQEGQRMEALGRMACAVAHDFNNLLSTLALTVGAAAVGDASAEVKNLASEMEDIIGMGKGLTAQLLAFGKHRADAELGAVELHALLDRMLPMLRTAIGRGIGLNLELDALPDARVVGDAAQLEQVILNLVLNARDAIATGAGSVSLRLREASADDEVPPDSVLLEVHDDGVGMDEDTRARVFEPFFSTKSSGTGLGLATVYGIVRRCGGVVRVKSEPGKGTTMQVALPRATGP